MDNLKRYIGKDCPKGHGGERYKSNWRCVRCCQLKKQAAKKAKRAANPKKRGRPSSGIDRTTEEYKERVRARVREYARSPEGRAKQLAYQRSTKGKTYSRNKKAKYRAAHLSRTPAWLTETDKWMIKKIYELAILRTEMTGIQWEVDHIIPLRGKTVSGLHVPTNLQVIPKLLNAKKGNDFSYTDNSIIDLTY